MTEDPLSEVEMLKSFNDLGSLGLSAYRGAIAAGATHPEAFTVCAALYAGMFKGSTQPPEENA